MSKRLITILVAGQVAIDLFFLVCIYAAWQWSDIVL